MTVLGQHTISETEHLMKTVDFRIQATDKVNNQIVNAQIQGNPLGYANLQTDWTNFKSRWASARDDVLLSLFLRNQTNPLVPASLITSEKEYKAIKKAINVGGEDTFTTGDLTDCIQRIEQFAQQQIEEKNAPIPDNFDLDLLAYKKLDSSIQAGEQAAKAAASAAGQAAKSNIGLIVGLGIVGVTGVIVASKVYL